MKEEIGVYRIEDLSEGKSFFFKRTISASDVDNFAAISGDKNSLHMENDFARSRGFSGRVVHGALFAGLISKIIGMHLPGENCLLQSMNLKFLLPAYIDDAVEIGATVEHVSQAANSIVLDVWVKNLKTGDMLVKGKAQVGFTGSRQ